MSSITVPHAGPAALALGILLTFQTSAAPPPGEFVDLGGYRLHYLSAGTGSPTVVLLHGSGDLALLWSRVSEKIAADTRVVAIDEHGMGWSDWGHSANTLRQQALDFHRLLESAGAKPPYVLVGHSRGGLVALHFVRQFRPQVAGVVLVDSSHPDMMLRYRQPDGSFRWQRVRDRARDRPVPEPTTAPIDSSRETRRVEVARDTSALTAGMPARVAALVQDRYHRTIAIPTELRSYFPEELREMADQPERYGLGDLPLRVVSAGLRDKEPDAEHTAAELIAESARLQRDLVALSTRGQQVVAEGSGHQIHLEQPEIVVDAVRAVIRELRLAKAPRLP